MTGRAKAPKPRAGARLGKDKATVAPLAEYHRKRDFSRTHEPAGVSARKPASKTLARRGLRFVIQKHAASHLHFDLRLELDGVMKSWAVPKGPSIDPTVKRLAMQVEDHPIEYNTFEGTIPAGQYGGGTVMLWDRGTYTTVEPSDDKEEALREGYRKGDFKIYFHGERMQGSYVLVRMKGGRFGSSDKPQWLFIKHRDEYAGREDIAEKYDTSVVSGRTMDEITADRKSKVWNSSEPKPLKLPKALEPMFASVGSEIPKGDWTFEPKYDGVRVLAFCTAKDARLVTRNGHDKSRQFPEIAEALRKLASSARRDFVLDGEVVALKQGVPVRFQELQGRMHVTDDQAIALHREGSPVGICLFDILVDGKDILIREPWSERRARLEKRIASRTSSVIRLGETSDDGEKLLAEAKKQGWEGIIAKRTGAAYEPGVRSRAWLKLKIEFRQEFAVGGYTEPRNSRSHIGAILLGYYDGDDFVYAGHTGGGFTNQGLADMYKLLAPLERDTPPFSTRPKTNEKPHWVRPKIVVEVKFSEWTADGKLRQPIYLGTRTDKAASEITREAMSVQPRAREPMPAKTTTPAKRKSAAKSTGKLIADAEPPVPLRADAARVLRQIDELCDSDKRGTLDFGKGRTLSVTNLAKVFFESTSHTKGDLLRYYTLVSPFILPTIADRPLVLKRFPNGIHGEAFYQQKASDDTPDAVRVEIVTNDDGEKQRRMVGGDLLTLLYTIQLGAVSVEPWHGRFPDLAYADYSIIDLDPGPKAKFGRVVQIATWVKEVLDELGLHAALKTSGSEGLHVYIPLPSKTPTDASTLVAQIVAERVAREHPKEATVKRFTKHRGEAEVYVDYLQNIKGKTVAGPYCVRAREGATVSTPIGWDELTAELDPRDFTIDSVMERFTQKGDIWGTEMKRKNSLRKLLAANTRKEK
ncbi:MAG: DNA ligase D [Gemmatimonadaceae bacterium]|nr:DNA ligase D [Gemmatimonadaceae bacterium]